MQTDKEHLLYAVERLERLLSVDSVSPSDTKGPHGKRESNPREDRETGEFEKIEEKTGGMLSYTHASVYVYLESLAVSVAPPPRTALDLYQLSPLSSPHALELWPCSDFISTGDRYVDQLLGQHGIMAGFVYEFCGPSGSGKTLLAIQISIMSQLSILKNSILAGDCDDESNELVPGGVVYLCTEDSFPIARYAQLLEYFIGKEGLGSKLAHKAQRACMDALFVQHIGDEASQCHVIHYYLEAMILQYRQAHLGQNITCIVIDSIAYHYRCKEISLESVQSLLLTSKVLKRLASLYHISIIIINQVSDWIPPNIDPIESRSIETDKKADNGTLEITNYHHFPLVMGGQHSLFSPLHSIPALGLTWSYCTHKRVYFYPHHLPLHSSRKSKGKMMVLFSHDLQISTDRKSLHYYIDENGLHATDNRD